MVFSVLVKIIREGNRRLSACVFSRSPDLRLSAFSRCPCRGGRWSPLLPWAAPWLSLCSCDMSFVIPDWTHPENRLTGLHRFFTLPTYLDRYVLHALRSVSYSRRCKPGWPVEPPWWLSLWQDAWVCVFLFNDSFPLFLFRGFCRFRRTRSQPSTLSFPKPVILPTCRFIDCYFMVQNYDFFLTHPNILEIIFLYLLHQTLIILPKEQPMVFIINNLICFY